MINKIKLALALLLVVAGVAGFYLLTEHATVIRIVAVLVGVIAAAVVFWTTPQGQVVFTFAREAAAETRKVVWPTRKETIQTTLAVFALVCVVAIFLWIVDLGFLWMVEKLLGRSA